MQPSEREIEITFTMKEIQDFVIPALHVCRAIVLKVQNHNCEYERAATIGANRLSEMLFIAQERGCINVKN